MRRFGMAIWLMILGGGFGGFSYWLWLVAWRLGKMHHPWLWLLMIIFSGLMMYLCLRAAWIVLMLLLGRTTPVLARRDFRDSIANMVFYTKTGGIKDF